MNRTDRRADRNVLGRKLEPCGIDPLTGFTVTGAVVPVWRTGAGIHPRSVRLRSFLSLRFGSTPSTSPGSGTFPGLRFLSAKSASPIVKPYKGASYDGKG